MIKNFFTVYGALALAMGVVFLFRHGDFNWLLLVVFPALAVLYTLAIKRLATTRGSDPAAATSKAQASAAPAEGVQRVQFGDPAAGGGLSSAIDCPECGFTVGSFVESCGRCSWMRPSGQVVSRSGS